jgi:protein-S-isoprenylcysteine O-methyltransferase Ste14
MKTIFKHLTSFILPITVLILVPRWIENDFTPKSLLPAISGVAFMLTGMGFLCTTIFSFFKNGKGTLAPWFPTRKLVITGLYRYMRNPMITGVLLVLTGETIFFLSGNIALWTIIFFAINNVYFLIYEEPSLENRFGDEYREYKRQVPRWIPRKTLFHPELLN